MGCTDILSSILKGLVVCVTWFGTTCVGWLKLKLTCIAKVRIMAWMMSFMMKSTAREAAFNLKETVMQKTSNRKCCEKYFLILLCFHLSTVSVSASHLFHFTQSILHSLHCHLLTDFKIPCGISFLFNKTHFSIVILLFLRLLFCGNIVVAWIAFSWNTALMYSGVRVN